MACRLIFFILLSAPFICCHLIRIISDFNSDQDVEFFKDTLPWIVDNFGPDISLKYHFIDSGIASGPRQCVLLQLRDNIYLQAEYLRCAAKYNSNLLCMKTLPINMIRLNRCIRRNVNVFVKNAEREYQNYRIDSTPSIILPKRIILSDLRPKNILSNICTLHLRERPSSCTEEYPNIGIKSSAEAGIKIGNSKQSDIKDTSKDETKPEELADGEETSKDENKTEKLKQLDGKETSKAGTKSEEQKQSNINETPNETTIEVSKQSGGKEIVTNETKPENRKELNRQATPKQQLRPVEPKQAGGMSIP